MGGNRNKIRLETFEFRKLDAGRAHPTLQVHILDGLSRQRAEGLENGQVFFGIMGVIFFIECFQHTNDFSAHHERDGYERVCLMLCYAVYNLEMTLVCPRILDH